MGVNNKLKYRIRGNLKVGMEYTYNYKINRDMDIERKHLDFAET